MPHCLDCAFGSEKFTDTELFEGVTMSNYIEIVNQNFIKQFIGSIMHSSNEYKKFI